MSEEVVVPSRAKRRPRAKAQEKAEWARRFFESGLSQREFGEREGLALSTLQRWVAENPIASSLVVGPAPCDPALSFAELKLGSLNGSPKWAAELCRPNGSILRLTPDLSAVLLEQLLRVC
jgi:hypothetical protein